MKEFMEKNSKNNNNLTMRINWIDINNMIKKIDRYKAKILKILYNKTNNIIILSNLLSNIIQKLYNNLSISMI